MANPPQGQQVRILIIARDQKKFQKAAQFLTRRGWPSDVVPGIKQAVEYVVKYRPMFVMVSFSIPNGNITKLPNLLMQTFNANCIAFGEGTDPKTTKRLNACRLKHIFYGALSGPSIHMRIKKILMEIEKEKQAAALASQVKDQPAPAAPPVAPAQATPPAQQQDLGSVEAMDSTPQGQGNNFNPQSFNPQEGQSQSNFQPSTFNPQANQGQGNFNPSTYNPQANQGQGNFNPESFDPQAGQGQGNFNSSSYNPQENQGQSNFQPATYNPQENQGGQPGGPAGSYNPQSVQGTGAESDYQQEQPQPSQYQEEDGENYWNDDKKKYGQNADADYDYGQQQQQPQQQLAEDGFPVPTEDDPMGLGDAGKMFEDAFAGAFDGDFGPNNGQPAAGGEAMGPDGQPMQPGSYNPQDGQNQGASGAMAPDAASQAAGGMQPGYDPNQPGGFNPQDGGQHGAMGGNQQGGYNPQQPGQAGAMPPGAADQVGGMQPGFDSNQPGSHNPQAGMPGHDQQGSFNPQAPGQGGVGNAQPPVNPNDMMDGSFDANLNPAVDDGGFGEMAPQEDVAGFDLDSLPMPELPADMQNPAADAAMGAGNVEPMPEPPSAMDQHEHQDDEDDEPPVPIGQEAAPKIGGSKVNNEKLKDIADIFDKGFGEMLEPSDEPAKPIGKANSVSVISVKSENVNGYILVAKPKAADLDADFTSSLSFHLQELVKSDMLELEVAESYNFDINTVSFVQWAATASDFVTVKQHKNFEVALAFFTIEDMPKIRKSEDIEDMSVVDVSSIVPEVQAEFRGYINFKKNDKLILYIKKGRSISDVQKNRLMNKSVEEMYIPNEEAEIFASQMAQEAINQKIASYLAYLKQLASTQNVA